MKRMLVQLGYDNWALASHEDAINLFAIFQRALKVKQASYSGPYIVEDDQTPPFESISLGDVGQKVEIAAEEHPF